jgi:hypothetical protein
MEIFNEQTESKTFFSSFENFEPSGDTGSPHFVGNTGNLSTWIKTNERIDIAQGEKIIVPYTITIPENAEPGGYFSAIFWGSQDPKTEEAGEVSIGGKLGVLILLRVAGDIHEEAGLSEFLTASGKRVFTTIPVEFSYRFTNKGDDRVVPLGDITVKNTLGSEVAVLKANESEGNVLPNSTRRFSVTWGDKNIPQVTGFLNQAKVWGSTNTTETASTWIFLFPWHALTIVGLVGLIVFFIMKRYNAWIISRNSKAK